MPEPTITCPISPAKTPRRRAMRSLRPALSSGRLLNSGCFNTPATAGEQAKTKPPQIKPQKGKLPLTGRAPAKLQPNLCLLRYRISTDSADCQAFFDQGLAWHYSYVYDSAAHAFETAVLHDPDCPMAWWGLSRAWFAGNKVELAQQALEKARANQNKASHRERFLISAMLLSKAPLPRAPPEVQRAAAEKNRLAAIMLIDELLSLYDDDEEGWFF